MKDPICPICNNAFLPTHGQAHIQKYCNNCKQSGAVHRYKYRLEQRLQVEDFKSFTSTAGSAVRWVRVVECPKDEPGDMEPPFAPGRSKFPLDQFIVGLKEGCWPVGMKVEVMFYTRKDSAGGRKSVRRRYTVPKKMADLVKRLEEEHRTLRGR